MKKPVKYKCPCCGNYTLDSRGMYDICPVCFWEDEDIFDDDEESGANGISLIQARENYKRQGANVEEDAQFIRMPLGIELPGFYEQDNKESTSDPKYLEYVEYLKNPDKTYKEAEQALTCSNIRYDAPESVKQAAAKEAFEKLNALAFTESEIGFKAAYDLAICYASGYGCKQDRDMAHFLLYEILKEYKIK